MSFLRRLSIAFGLEKLPEKKEFLTPRVIAKGPETTWEERVAPEVPIGKLETLYKLDGLIFNAINRFTRGIVSPGFYFEGEEEDVKKIEEWSLRVKLKSRLYPVVQDCFIAGRSWIELSYNKAEDDIVRLINVNPKRMDFIRDITRNTIIFTETGEPFGYVHSPIMGTKKYFTVDSRRSTRDFTVPSTEVFPKDNIAYFKFFSVGGSYLGMSPLEPLYKPILIKLNIEDSLGEAIFRSGYPIKIAYLGDVDHEPPQEALDKVADDLKNLESSDVLSFPYYYKIDQLQPSRLEKIHEHLEHFTEIIAASLGVPRYFVMGLKKGEVVGRAIEYHFHDFEEQISYYQERLAEQVETEILSKVCELEGIDEVPRMKWYKVTPTTMYLTARRLGVLVRAGLLTPDKNIEDRIRRQEGLPEITREEWLALNQVREKDSRESVEE